MFASDYNRAGVVKSYFVSITIHLLIFLLIFFYQQKQKSKLADYTLTEITMIQEIPEQPKPMQMQIEKPKKVFDILKQVIPIKQQAQIEIAKPQKLELDRPKLEMKKPEALSLDKSKIENLKPAAKPIDLDNEIGQRKISPAMVQAQIDLQKKQALASAPSTKIDLGAQTKRSSLLPVANPGGISLDSSKMQTGIKQSTFKLGKPTPEPKKASSLATENIVIEKKQALLIQGDIAGRPILVAKKPTYPLWAQQQGLEASVTIYFVVRPDGTVKDNLIIERSSGYPELDQLAKEALLQFKFAPISGSDEQSGYATFRFMLEK
ncbi:MAG: TonB family protein [Candidatus Goldbacteria bacterium]|nr:TonB family protein [Candidatus Goldiibacteriota bacterium]